MLQSEAFFQDERVKRAKEILLSVLREYQSQLHFSPEPQSDLVSSFSKKLDHFSELRGGKLWYPYISSGLGKGALVELLDGSVKYDFISGIGAHFGHSLPLLVESSLDAALQDTVMQGNLQQNDDSRRLLDLLLDTSKLDHGILTTSGVMAAENGLKLAFQNKFPASRVLAFEKCFMGRTLAVSQITDKPKYRDGLPETMKVDYLPFYDYLDPEGSLLRCKSRLITLLKRYPNQYAVMCFELVQGEGGYFPGTSTFFKEIIQILKENNIAILVDEIQTFGRTKNLYAFQTFGLDNVVDIVTIGKLSQVCATLYKHEFKPRPGLISQTFTGSTTAISSAIAIIQHLLKADFLGEKGKIQVLSDYFRSGLMDLHSEYPELIEGPYGFGSMIAFTPLKGNKEKVLDLSHRLYRNGVLSFVAGEDPMRLRFLMPMGDLATTDIDIVLGCIKQSLLESTNDS